MKPITLNRKSIIGRIDSLLFEYPAQDICSLTHRIIWSLVLSPLLVISALFSFMMERRWKDYTLFVRAIHALGVILIVVMVWAVGVKTLRTFFPDLTDITTASLALIVGPIMCSIPVLLVLGIIVLDERLTTNRHGKPGHHIFKSIKNKTCSKIDWE